jgi:hypothetical protein
MSDEKLFMAERAHLLSDGTEICFRALSQAEIARIESVKSRGSIDVERESLPPEVLVMMYTITTAVLRPTKVLDILFDGMDSGSLDEVEMVELHNAILDFTMEQLLAREPAKGRA